jgi:RNA polymerase sigma-B factor
VSEVSSAGVHKGPEANGNGVGSLNGRSVDRGQAKDLFRRFVETRSPALREELVGLHLPLVEYLARRFRNRGEPLEDLVQVGTIEIGRAHV